MLHGNSAQTAIYCWEYGAGTGHLNTLSALASRMRKQFSKAILVNPSGATVSENIDAFDEIVSFPGAGSILDPEMSKLEKIVSYNDVLKGFGFCQPKFLFTRFTLWKQLFEQIKPTIVIGDYAPSAMLVARKMGFPTVATGNGYTLPPTNIQSYPRFLDRPDFTTDEEILKSVNKALSLASLGIVDHVPEIFGSDIHACFTEQALDPFAKVREPCALGPMFNTLPPAFNENRSDGVFVYLTRCDPMVSDLVLRAMRQLVCPVQIYALNNPRLLFEEVKASNMILRKEPLSLETICSEFRLCVHLGSHNLAMELLYAGMPQLILPIDMEKLLYAQTLENNGYAHQLRMDRPTKQSTILQKIQYAIADAELAGNLEQFSVGRHKCLQQSSLEGVCTAIARKVAI